MIINFSPPFTLAHGTLGIFDELFVLLAMGLFVIMLAAPVLASILKRDQETPDAQPPESTNIAQKTRRGDHFRLD